jgi:hypothetical protein
MQLQKFYFILSVFLIFLSSFHLVYANADIETTDECLSFGANCQKALLCSTGQYDIGDCDGWSPTNPHNCCHEGIDTGFMPDADCINKYGGYCTLTGVTSPCNDNQIFLGDCESTGMVCCKSKLNTSTYTPPPDPKFDYTALEQIPGTEGDLKNFPDYIKALYKFVIWGVAIAGLLMLVIGGFWYMTAAGNNAQLSKAKDIIRDALLGIIVALFAWLLLFTINPDLVRIDISSLSALHTGTTPSSTATPGGAQSQPVTPTTATGSCGGLPGNVGSQCDLASSDLISLMSCMADKNISHLGVVSSVTAENVGNDFDKAKNCCGDESCTHSDYTCHYGCKVEPGYSHAFDFDFSPNTMSDADLCKIAEAAKTCGSGVIWGPRTLSCGIKRPRDGGHDGHLHISTAACNG